MPCVEQIDKHNKLLLQVCSAHDDMQRIQEFLYTDRFLLQEPVQDAVQVSTITTRKLSNGKTYPIDASYYLRGSVR